MNQFPLKLLLKEIRVQFELNSNSNFKLQTFVFMAAGASQDARSDHTKFHANYRHASKIAIVFILKPLQASETFYW